MEKIKQKLEKDIRVLRDPEYGYLRAGYPRFMRLFGRDSLIAAWQLIEKDPSVAKDTLQTLSKLQGKKYNDENEEEPGKILHETDLETGHHPTHPEISFPYYGSVDSTPLFLIVFEKYVAKTGDFLFLKNHLQSVKSAAEWIIKKTSSDPTGLIRYQRKREKGQLFHQGWKDGFNDDLKISPPVAVVEAQGYGFAALKSAAELLPNRTEKENLNKEAARLRENLLKNLWIEEKNFSAFALNGKNEKRRAITSNPGHLLFTGVIDDETKIKAVMEKLFAPPLWTKYGIRNHSKEEPDFDYKSYHFGSVWPHDNWIIAEGCRKLGYEKEYQKIKTALVTAFKNLKCLPEYYEVSPEEKIEKPARACSLQAWSSGALLNLLTSL